MYFCSSSRQQSSKVGIPCRLRVLISGTCHSCTARCSGTPANMRSLFFGVQTPLLVDALELIGDILVGFSNMRVVSLHVLSKELNIFSQQCQQCQAQLHLQKQMKRFLEFSWVVSRLPPSTDFNYTWRKLHDQWEATQWNMKFLRNWDLVIAKVATCPYLGHVVNSLAALPSLGYPKKKLPDHNTPQAIWEWSTHPINTLQALHQQLWVEKGYLKVFIGKRM